MNGIHSLAVFFYFTIVIAQQWEMVDLKAAHKKRMWTDGITQATQGHMQPILSQRKPVIRTGTPLIRNRSGAPQYVPEERHVSQPFYTRMNHTGTSQEFQSGYLPRGYGYYVPEMGNSFGWQRSLPSGAQGAYPPYVSQPPAYFQYSSPAGHYNDYGSQRLLQSHMMQLPPYPYQPPVMDSSYGQYENGSSLAPQPMYLIHNASNPLVDSLPVQQITQEPSGAQAPIAIEDSLLDIDWDRLFPEISTLQSEINQEPAADHNVLFCDPGDASSVQEVPQQGRLPEIDVSGQTSRAHSPAVGPLLCLEESFKQKQEEEQEDELDSSEKSESPIMSDKGVSHTLGSILKPYMHEALPASLLVAIQSLVESHVQSQRVQAEHSLESITIVKSKNRDRLTITPSIAKSSVKQSGVQKKKEESMGCIKRTYNRKKPERSHFDTDEAFRAAYDPWKKRRDNNKKAVDRFRREGPL